jgi:hypothetical protein
MEGVETGDVGGAAGVAAAGVVAAGVVVAGAAGVAGVAVWARPEAAKANRAPSRRIGFSFLFITVRRWVCRWFARAIG